MPSDRSRYLRIKSLSSTAEFSVVANTAEVASFVGNTGGTCKTIATEALPAILESCNTVARCSAAIGARLHSHIVASCRNRQDPSDALISYASNARGIRGTWIRFGVVQRWRVEDSESISTTAGLTSSTGASHIAFTVRPLLGARTNCKTTEALSRVLDTSVRIVDILAVGDATLLGHTVTARKVWSRKFPSASVRPAAEIGPVTGQVGA